MLENSASKKIDYIITVGDNGRVIAKGALESGFDANCAFSFNNNAEVNRFLKDFVKSGDVILVKGSRGMKMEEIIRQLTGGA